MIWFWMQVFTMLTGTFAWLVWKLFGQSRQFQLQIPLLRGILWGVILNWLVPVLLVIWWIREPPYKFHRDIFGVTPVLKTVLKNVFLVWLIGFLVNAFCFAVQFHQIHTDKKRARILNGRIKEKETAICRKFGIKRVPMIYQSSAIVSPVTTGIIRQGIFLPDTTMEEDVELVLTHELMHLKHRDYWMRYALILIHCIHWYNPFARQLFWDANEWNEHYCDFDCCRELQMKSETYFAHIRECIKEIRRQKEMRRLQSGLCKNQNSMRKREELMNKVEVVKMKGKMVRRAVIIGSMAITLLLGYAVSYGAVIAYDQTVRHTAVEIQLPMDETELELFVETVQDAPKNIAVIEEMLEITKGRTSTLKEWSLDPVQEIRYSAIYLEKGAVVDLYVSSSQIVDYGLILPDGTKNYVTAQKGDRSFEISESGEYRIFIRNRNNVSASGSIIIILN